ncbi:MAG: fasciclin domain-containing protein [Thermoanaerobaculales bacterium]|nr:fasciclin domain-containing protein [Thermoanaerobaculales bacterium]
MRKSLLVVAVIALFAVSPAFAHCGKCGTGEAHNHVAEASTSDIVGVASSAGSFNTLLAAAKAAGLVDTLQSEGPFTVFAPTDEAFAKLPAGTVENLLANPDQLKQILLYHVVPGKVTASDVVSLSSATTAQGSDIAIAVKGDTVMINNARVTQADVMASNGVIHVIDTVIVPSA